MLRAILYLSVADPGLGHKQLSELVKGARSKNAASGITGLLHYESGVFTQWLEGPPSAIDTLWNKLFLDRRHCKITKVFSGSIPARRFADWDMEFAHQKERSLFDFISEKGMSPAVSAPSNSSKLLTAVEKMRRTNLRLPLKNMSLPVTSMPTPGLFNSNRTAAL